MPNINLESNDKTVFSVDVEVAKKSITLRDLMMNYGIEETGDEDGDPIPLPKVDAANLERLLLWAEKHKDDPPAPTDDETKYRTDNISNYDKEFFNMDQAALLQLIHAANFMNMPDLLLTACKIVATMISSLSSIQDWQNLPDVLLGDTQKFRENVVERIRLRLSDDQYLPPNSEISQAKILGKTG